jgi:WD40 repeat protein
MKPDESTPLEEQLPDLLTACDEALAAGLALSGLCGPDVSAELRRRLEEGVACMRHLRRWWPAGHAPEGARADGDGQPPACPFQTLGRFQVRRELGRGTFGLVFLAYDPQLCREVALKVPRPEALVAPELRDRFLREARAAAALNHPNLVHVYETGAVGPVCYIASAYCPGTTLAAWLKERDPAAVVPVRPAAALLATLAEAVEHAHGRGVVHRDLKPSNVLLEPVPGGAADALDFVPRIADFGLAKVLADGNTSATWSGTLVGTPVYMAPEQAAGKSKEIGPAADVYALGTILYELLAGHPPFHGETVLDVLEQVCCREPVPPSRLRPGVPRDLETICLKCLQKESARRYPSAQALADDLRRFLAGKPVVAKAVGLVERGWKWARRRPALAVLAGISGIALIGLLIVSLWYNGRLHDERDRAVEQEGIARQREADARRLEGLAHRHLYAAHLNLAQRAADAGRVDRVLDLLEGQRPRAGEEDLRGFEWYYLWRFCHGERFAWRARPADDDRAPRSWVLAPDGQTAATADGPDIKLWDVTTGRELGTLSGHLQKVRDVGFTADGRTLVSAAGDGTARLWDVSTRRLRATFGWHPYGVIHAVVSPDGRWLATSGTDGSVKIWEVAGRRAVALLQTGAKTSAYRLLFSPDGRSLVVVTEENRDRAELWDVSAGKLRAVLEDSTDKIERVGFSPDSRSVATGTDAQVKLWDTATGKELTTFRDPDGYVTCLAFAPDGRTLATAVGRPFDFLKAGRVTLWDRATLKESASWEVAEGGAWALAFAPDGNMLAVGENGGAITLWDLPSRQQRAVLRGHTNRVASLAFSPGGTTLASDSLFDGTGRLWDLVPSPQPAILRDHSGPANVVAFAPDGQTWASGGADGTVRLRDPVRGQERANLWGYAGAVRAVAFSPDSKTVAAGRADGTIKLWDLTGKAKATLVGHKQEVQCVKFSPDGRLLVSAAGRIRSGTRGDVKLWDLATGKERASWPADEDIVRSVAFSPDGRLLASASEGRVKVWDTVTGEERFFRRTADVFMAVAFSPDGRRLAAGGWNTNGVWLWDLDGGGEHAVLKGHSGAVLSVAFNPDGRTLASGSRDGTVKLWDIATGQVRFTLRGRQAPVCSVAFRPDGKALVAALDDGAVELWDAALPPPQVQAVAWQLLRCNPGFDGRVTPRIEDGVVTGLELLSDEVTDLSPLRSLPGLKRLSCNGSAPGKGKLRDLSALRDLPLTALSCANTRVSDLTPLAGKPLHELDCTATPVSDLSPLKGAPLTTLKCAWTQVSDLSPLRGMALTLLACHNTPVSDLAPLQGMPLTVLGCGGTQVADLAPLKGMPLTELYCAATPVADLSPLKGMRLEQFACGDTPVADLSPLDGMPLTLLYCYRTRIPDLKSLRTLPLVEVSCDVRSDGDARVLRKLERLATINGAPAARFWEKAAAGRQANNP